MSNSPRIYYAEILYRSKGRKYKKTCNYSIKLRVWPFLTIHSSHILFYFMYGLVYVSVSAIDKFNNHGRVIKSARHAHCLPDEMSL
mmetsp:Transcript_1557/g.3224  ORF Transcript_1557/g.3224 Transcript_1557/m.3224 type:complete len:86 (-) Transcript_1557:524-781(-)